MQFETTTSTSDPAGADLAEGLSPQGIPVPASSTLAVASSENAVPRIEALPDSSIVPVAENGLPGTSLVPIPTRQMQTIDATPSQELPSASLAEMYAGSQPRHVMLSTLVSLMVVLILMIAVRLVVPPLVESIRYSWFRGQLRAEYELSGERLNTVALNSLADVSKLISQRVGPSVVHINLMRDELRLLQDEKDESLGLLPSFPKRSMLLGQGSGFVIDTAGHILTNQHVIDGVDSIEVSLSDGRRIPATVFQIDPLTDLAILKIDADGLMPVAWGNSDGVDVGSPVWAVGSPFGLEQSVTFGILSGKHRINLKGIQHDMPHTTAPAYTDLMQSDVAVNPGNSGGPLVNSAGEVVGVNTAIVGDSYRGISFSIPSNVARVVAHKLISDGEVVRGWLGVHLQDFSVGEETDSAGKQVRGALVMELVRTGPSPAREAGMLPGDIIVNFDGKSVVGYGELMSMIALAKVDSSVQVVVLRNRKRISLDVKIARRQLDVNRR